MIREGFTVSITHLAKIISNSRPDSVITARTPCPGMSKGLRRSRPSVSFVIVFGTMGGTVGSDGMG